MKSVLWAAPGACPSSHQECPFPQVPPTASLPFHSPGLIAGLT